MVAAPIDSKRIKPFATYTNTDQLLNRLQGHYQTATH